MEEKRNNQKKGKIKLKMKIRIVDAICGSGKTNWCIQEMNNNKNKRYMYITPFLSEIERVINSTNINIKAPEHKGRGKLENLEQLILNTTKYSFQRMSYFKDLT